MRRVNARVTGMVQGVFFRVSTQRAAESFGVCGIVRNEPDGSVYIEAEGDDDAVERFLDWCRKGPSRARVDRLDVQEAEPSGYDSFEVTG